jgi:hypothetical protein
MIPINRRIIASITMHADTTVNGQCDSVAMADDTCKLSDAINSTFFTKIDGSISITTQKKSFTERFMTWNSSAVLCRNGFRQKAALSHYLLQ